MMIWVDGDSCPRDIKALIRRTAGRRKIPAVFVANRFVVREDDWVSMRLVGPEEGAADEYLISNAQPGDVIVTRDIPLAAELLSKDVTVLNDRGRIFDQENIGELLSLRDFSKELREYGMFKARESRFGRNEVKRFADAFDRILTGKRRKGTEFS